MAGSSRGIIEDNRSIENELELCRQIQMAMVPRSLPILDGIDVRSVFSPCGALGGDLFDVIAISDDVLAFFMFDVASYGVPSALISSIAKVSFSNHIRLVDSPASVLGRVNSEMRSSLSSDFYLTAFVGYLDLHSNKLTYCGAGHPRPILYRKKDQSTHSLDGAGSMIGVFDDVFYEDEKIHLYPGDWFLLFTDGLYDIYNCKNEVDGRQSLENAINNCGINGPESLIDSFTKKCEELSSADMQKDDITALSVEILSQSRKEQIKDKLGFKRSDPVHLQYLSYYEEMDKAVGFVLRDMDAMAFADDDIRRMKIALTELLANAIGHGNKEDHSKKVIMGHVVNRVSAVVGIMDEGDGFVPDDVPDPTLPENLMSDHGRGLFIVRNYVDVMEFNENGNRIFIRKYHDHD